MERYSGLSLQNTNEVVFVFAPNLHGTIVKTHIPDWGDITFDVMIRYRTGSLGHEVDETVRLRDVPGKALIKVENAGNVLKYEIHVMEPRKKV